MSQMHPETKQTIELVILALEENPTISISAHDIAKKIGKTKGRNVHITKALKWLKRNNKIVQFSNGEKGPGSTYMIVRKTDQTSVIPVTKQEPLPLDPRPAEAYKSIPPKIMPVCTVEIPKATLKVMCKAIMANCLPMDNILQRAVLQCMEKLI